MPWEETEAYIRSGHREPGETCRTIELSRDLGIKAIYCRYGEKWAIQSYLFSKDKGWTLDKAKEWFEQHKAEAVQDGVVFFDLKVLADSADPDKRIFPWSMPARFYMKPGRMLIYGTALVAGKTRKGDEFSHEELRRAARSLIGGPIEVFRHSWETGENYWLPWPDNVILDAEEVDGRIEYIAGISDPQVQELIRKGELNQVSVNAICRYVPKDNPGKCNGVIFSGFCLVPKDAVAASPGTCVKVWNCLGDAAHRLEGVGEAKPPEAEVETMSENKKMEENTSANANANAQTNAQANTQPASTSEPSQHAVLLTEQFKQELFEEMRKIAKAVFEQESEREKLHQAQMERAKKYGISPKPDGHLTKPKEYENIPEDEFADPVNYKYPIDNEEHVRGALTYFNQPQKREAGGYTTEEAAKILEKIIRKALSLGITVSWQPEDPAYKALPEEVKEKLEGYQQKSETAKKSEALPVAAVKPVENVKPAVFLTEEEIVAVLSDKRRFTPALQLRGLLDLLAAKKRGSEKA